MQITRPVILGTLAIISGSILASCGSSTSATSTGSACGSHPTVTAHGAATATGTPDIATIGLAVQTQASTATAALSQNASLAKNLINSLTQNGIQKSDVQTSGLSLNAIYGGPSASITGYQVTNRVNAKITNLASLGKIVDSAASAAGNAVRVNQITFSVKNSSSLFGQARAKAVTQAEVEAKAMASASGKSLGMLCSINDSTSSSSPKIISSFSAASGSSASTPIEPGNKSVTAIVSAVYELG